jgi:tetratricopeptide (TPR) repeat protein
MQFLLLKSSCYSFSALPEPHYQPLKKIHMKHFSWALSLGACAAWILTSFCTSNTPKKITDIPVTTSSDSAKAAFEQGLKLVDQNDYLTSRPYFAKAIELDPKISPAYIFRIFTDFTLDERLADLKNAKDAIDTAKSSEWEILYTEFYSSFFKADYKSRLEIAKKIAADYPDAARAQADLGSTYLNGNEFGKARECYQKAVALDSTWPGGYLDLVNLYEFYDPKNFKLAELNAEKLAALAPASPGAQVTLGDCYRAENELDKARNAYTKCLQLDSTSRDAYYKLGHVSAFLGKYEEARKSYGQAVKFDKTQSVYIVSCANSYLYAGDYKMALEFLYEQIAKIDSSGESASARDGDKYDAYSAGVQISFHCNQPEALKEFSDRLAPISDAMAKQVGTPEAKAVYRAETWSNEALFAVLKGKYDEAAAKAVLAKKSLDSITEPNHLNTYYFVLGQIAMRQKKYTDAIENFGKTDLSSVYNKYWLALANEMAGNKDKAQSLYQDIVNYNFDDTNYALFRNEVRKKLNM